jgi:hypothetical protein
VNGFVIGNLVRVSAAFADAAGVDTDPVVVSCKVRNPSGTMTTSVYGTDAALVKDSTGHYHLDVDVNLVGEWHYRWWSTGSGKAAGESGFLVWTSLF